jgi:hypothetical protein
LDDQNTRRLHQKRTRNPPERPASKEYETDRRNTPDEGDRCGAREAQQCPLDFVLGNKVMVGSVNASRDNFENDVRDMSQAEAEYPGWLRRLLTHPVRGLESYRELFDRLQNPNGAIKIFCEVG